MGSYDSRRDGLDSRHVPNHHCTSALDAVDPDGLLAVIKPSHENNVTRAWN